MYCSVGETFTLQFGAVVTAYNRAASAINNIGTEFETSRAPICAIRWSRRH